MGEERGESGVVQGEEVCHTPVPWSGGVLRGEGACDAPAPQMVEPNRWATKRPYTNLQGEVVWVEIMENTEYLHCPGFCGYNNDFLNRFAKLNQEGEEKPTVVSPNAQIVQVPPTPPTNPQWCLPEFRSSSQGPPIGGAEGERGDRGDPPPRTGSQPMRNSH